MSQVGYIHTAIGYRIFGNRNPRGAAQLNGLGDDSTTLADMGFSPGQIQQILQFHASGALSDNGFQFLLAGGVPTTDLDNFLNQDPGASDAPARTPGAITQGAAGIPQGTSLLYSATWETSLHNSDPQDILRQVSAALGGYGLQVLGQTSNTGVGGTLWAAAYQATQFQVQILLSVSGAGFNRADDVRSIIDHQVYLVTGQMPLASSINVGSMGSGGTAALAAPNLTTFVEQNAPWLFIGVAAIFILPSLIRKL